MTTPRLQLYRDPKLLDYIHVCLNLTADEREQIEAFTGRPYDAEETAFFHCQKKPAWMLCEDEKPIAIAGFDMIRPGVWQDWMLNTPVSFEKYWRTTTKHVKRVMDAMLKQDAHRLQCVSLASRIHAHKWYAVLGLAPEAPLRAYGANGEDAIMFARLRDEPDGQQQLRGEGTARG